MVMPASRTDIGLPIGPVFSIRLISWLMLRRIHGTFARQAAGVARASVWQAAADWTASSRTARRLRGAAILSRSVKLLPGATWARSGNGFLLCMGLFSQFLFWTTRQARFIVRKVME
ncbi:hypothetical protein [Bradyrhizobium sp. 191]|uniref:hypothetical protein n=1 Tax=Bradyrhizobium sp. 191 TaxID=2782659 RepID=UPI001FFF8863|nr:hypothetical protein [Bradyrhizobium sp. 191]UPJ68760.1 hypothetical protein IVB23_16740 [Bradyrhizobium sp. 191]